MQRGPDASRPSLGLDEGVHAWAPHTPAAAPRDGDAEAVGIAPAPGSAVVPVAPVASVLPGTAASPAPRVAGPAMRHVQRAAGPRPWPTPEASSDDLPLARPSTLAAASTDAPATGMQTIVFPGAASLASGAGATAPVQRAATADGPSAHAGLPGLTAMPVVQRADDGASAGQASAGAEGGGEHSEEDLQRLAGALYGRLRAQLRNELIHEREARGLTFDSA